MNRCTFNPDQIRQLEASLCVDAVSDRKIQYNGEFKIHAVRENLAGKGPMLLCSYFSIDQPFATRLLYMNAIPDYTG